MTAGISAMIRAVKIGVDAESRAVPSRRASTAEDQRPRAHCHNGARRIARAANPTIPIKTTASVSIRHSSASESEP